MARTAPVPNIPPIPGMCPSIAVLGGGGGGGGGSGNGAGDGDGSGGAGGDGSGDAANGDGRNAQSGDGNCGGQASCPNDHGGSSGGAAAGDPVDVVTGRTFTVPVTDLELAGPLPLSILRAYSSGARDRDIGLGYGWSHSLSWTIETTRSVFRVYKWDGTAVDFDAFADGLCGVGPNGWILSKSGRQFVLLLEDRTQLKFEAAEESEYALTSISDRFGNTIRLVQQNGQLAEVIDSVGRRIRVSRHPDGHISAFEVNNAWAKGTWVSCARYEYDAAGDLVGALDALGHGTTFSYDAHRLTAQRSPTGLTYHYRYDQGRCVETWGDYEGKADPSLADDLPPFLADGKTRARGIYHVVLEFGPDGYREVANSITVDRVVGNAHGTVDKCVRAGAVYSRTYDENGHVLSFTDPLGASTKFQRDFFGRVIEVTDPLGRVTRTERDDRGNVIRAVDAMGGVTEVRSLPDGLAWTDPLGATFVIKNDPRGLMTEAHAPNGGVSRYTYDAHGNCVREVDRVGLVTERTFDFFGRCVAVKRVAAETRFSYDDRGDIVRKTYPDGSTVHYRYNGARKLIAITEANNRTTEFVRGGDHRVHTIRKPDGTTTRFLWNREQRLQKVINGAGEEYLFEVDAAGRVVSETTFDGRTRRYRYDAAGNLNMIRTAERTIELKHDLAGQLVARTVGDVAETFKYDALGRMTSATRNGVALNLEYNAVGWPVRETARVGETVSDVSWAWDLMGDVIGRQTSLGHRMTVERDVIGRPVRYEADELELGRSFDGLHLEVARTLGGGGSVETVRDTCGRLAARTVRGNGAAETVGQSWAYGPRGELELARDRKLGDVSFEHDENGRLTAAIGDDVAHFYRYDGADNRSQVSAGAQEFAKGGRIERKGERTYEWSALGRLVRVIDESGGVSSTTRYAWADDGMLARVDTQDGRSIEFEYDAFRRRVAKRVKRAGRVEALTSFVWDRTSVVHSVRRAADQAGQFAEETTYSFDDDGAPLAQKTVVRRGDSAQSDGWLHFLNGPLGTPERLVRSDGSVAKVLHTDIWGDAVEGSDDATLRLPGQQFDAETGLSYNRYRYYDPELGSYISPDPLGLYGGLNLYAYAANEPTRLTDPTGLMPQTTITRPNGSTASGTSAGRDRDPRPRVQDPAISTAVENARTSGAGQVPTNSHGNCAEVDALHNLASDIRQERAAAGQTLPNAEAENTAIRQQVHDEVQNGSMRTVDDSGRPMNPCTSCGQILRELGLHPKSPHYDPPKRRNGVMGRDGGQWNGTDCQQGRNAHTRDRSVRGRTPPFVEPPPA